MQKLKPYKPVRFIFLKKRYTQETLPAHRVGNSFCTTFYDPQVVRFTA